MFLDVSGPTSKGVAYCNVQVNFFCEGYHVLEFVCDAILFEGLHILLRSFFECQLITDIYLFLELFASWLVALQKGVASNAFQCLVTLSVLITRPDMAITIRCCFRMNTCSKLGREILESTDSFLASVKRNF